MAIQIVKADEKLTYHSDGSKIFYRRIPSSTRGGIVKKYTKRGVTDWDRVTQDLLAYVVTGWENVKSGKTDVQFDPELVPMLPEETLTDILDLSGGASPVMATDEDLEKN
jgi:hypothetical protein